MDDLLRHTLLAGVGIALFSAPMGVFIVWRRMAYFGDTLAHASLLSVALALFMSWQPALTVVLVCLTLALLLVALQGRQHLATDTLLGILSHSTLAMGLIGLSLLPAGKLNLFAYLFGDLLTVTHDDMLMIYGIGFLLVLVLALIWRHLLAITVHEELAAVEGTPVLLVRFIFMLLLALLIAMTMKIVGVLLITALLIIPAAAARCWSYSPEHMVLITALLSVSAVLGGVGASFTWDLPTGPAITLTAGGVFLLSQLSHALVLRLGNKP